jgi:hypothetical protein
MVEGLIIISTYLLSAIMVHIAYNRMNTDDEESKHYVLHTLNNQLHIEWIIRSLSLFYWVQGKSIYITIMDEGSSDDTLSIVRLLSRHYQLDVRLMDDDLLFLNHTRIHIRLSHPEDLLKLPQLQL